MIHPDSIYYKLRNLDDKIVNRFSRIRWKYYKIERKLTEQFWIFLDHDLVDAISLKQAKEEFLANNLKKLWKKK